MSGRFDDAVRPNSCFRGSAFLRQRAFQRGACGLPFTASCPAGPPILRRGACPRRDALRPFREARGPADLPGRTGKTPPFRERAARAALSSTGLPLYTRHAPNGACKPPRPQGGACPPAGTPCAHSERCGAGRRSENDARRGTYFAGPVRLRALRAALSFARFLRWGYRLPRRAVLWYNMST